MDADVNDAQLVESSVVWVFARDRERKRHDQHLKCYNNRGAVQFELMGSGIKQLADKLSTVAGVESVTEIVVSAERLEEITEGESPIMTDGAHEERTSNILQVDSPDRRLVSTGVDLIFNSRPVADR